jgi:TfoX/Sxy family transcriptional regulator of competence genes
MAYDEGLADRVRSILQGRVTRLGKSLLEKRMFGGLVFMVDGNMCCGVRNTELMLRLSNEGASQALQRPHTRPLDPTGKRIRSLIFVNGQGTDLDRALEGWVEIALTFVRTLPAKQPGVKTKRQKTSPALTPTLKRR